MSRLAVALVDGHRQRLVAERPKLEEAVDLVGSHRGVLVAREAGDLGVGVPALERADVLRDVLPEHDELPLQPLGEPCGAAHGGTVYHRPHAALERARRARRLHHPHIGEDVAPRRVPADTRRGRAPDRGRVPHGPPLPRGGPARDRHRLGDDRERRRAGRGHRSERPRGGVRPVLRHQRGGRRRARERRARAGRSGIARPRRRRGDVRGDRGGVRPGSQGRAARRAARAGRSEDRARDRPRPVGRAADRAAGGLGRGRAREGVRPAARCREARGDAHRRHRGHGESRSRGPPGGRRARAVPPAEVHARVAGRGRGRDPPAARADGLGRGQVRRHPLPAAPRGDHGSPVLPRPPRHLERVSRGRRRRPRTCRGPASSTASSSPGAMGRSCRSSPSRRDWAGRTRQRRCSRRCR